MATDVEDAAFVKEYAELVESIARQTMAQLALRCEVSDLIGYGYTGLLEAKGRFDASKGVPFKAFAYYRIRGAVLDGVRQMAYLPRRAHARLRAAELADQEAEHVADARAQQQPAPGSVATATQAASSLDSILGRMAAAYCVTTSALEHDTGETDPSPESRLEAKQRRERVLAAVNRLPEKERLLISGYYLHGRSLTDVAAELGLSTSWGSRVQSRALSLLRRALKDAAL